MSDREIYILKKHPAQSYAKIGEDLGITAERVRQIKAHAERSIREEKQREQRFAKEQLLITVTMKRGELHVILRALGAYQYSLLRAETKSKRKRLGEDPDAQISEALINRLSDLLKQTTD